MKFSLQIILLVLTLASCSHSLFKQNREREIDHLSKKLDFVEFIKHRYSEKKIYLADSATKHDMWQLLENWKRVKLVYNDIDSLVEESSGLSFLKQGLTEENLVLQKTLCQDIEICHLDQNIIRNRDSIMFISEPLVYLLNDRPVVFLATKYFDAKTIQLKEGDTTLLISEFYLWSAILDSNEWKGKMLLDLNF